MRIDVGLASKQHGEPPAAARERPARLRLRLWGWAIRHVAEGIFALQRWLPLHRLDPSARTAPPFNTIRHVASNAEQYIEVLRSAVPKVVRLPARDDMPDSCFVEDPINAVPGSATLLPMGHARREAEAAAMQHDAAATGSPVPAPAGGSLAASGELAVALETGVARLTELCATGALRSADAAPAVRAQRPRVDGGDVLFTGHELVVGLSARSNLAGACALAAAHAFAVPVIAVDLERVAGEAGEEFSMLHLKSVATMLGPELLLAQDDAVGRGVASAIRSARSGLDRAVKRPAPDSSGPQRDRPRAGDPRSGDRPSVWVVPGGSAGSPSDRGLASARGLGEVLVPASEAAANVVFANGLVMRPPASTAPRSAAIIDEAAGRAGLRVEEVDMSELAKSDGALTCCSVLLWRA